MTSEQKSSGWDWTENWARIPDTPSGRENGRTHGVAGTSDGDVVVFCQAIPSVLIFGADGQLKSSWGEFPKAHGLTLVNEGGQDYLWLTTEDPPGAVVKATLDGKIVQTLTRPEIDVYSAGGYSPTWVAVSEERVGGNGDIWVADGYGKSLVHRFDRSGRYLASLTGEEGAGRFKCPHCVYLDTRKPEPEIYIADRGNQRIQVFDLTGKFKRVFGANFLTSPCSFVSVGALLFVPELRARLTVLDIDDKPIDVVGDNDPTADIPGWPNHPKELIHAGKFNSPHGIGADIHGNVYVVEWIIGGRITKLTPRA